MSSNLCGINFLRRLRKLKLSTSSPSHEQPGYSHLTTAPPPPPPPPPTTVEATEDRCEETENQTQERKELPLPPGLKHVRETSFSCNDHQRDHHMRNMSTSSTHDIQLSSSTNKMRKSASTRSFRAKISLKLPRSMSFARNKEDNNNNQKKKGKLKPEDSVWMKTIILGEKCKVPDGDEEEEEVVIYDKKGNKVSAYHPKNSNSLSMSRLSKTMSRQNSILSRNNLSRQNSAVDVKNLDF